MSFPGGLYLGSILVVGDMSLTILAIILNLSVVISIRNTQDSVEDNNNILQLNLVLNNLIICVLVKSFEELSFSS